MSVEAIKRLTLANCALIAPLSILTHGWNVGWVYDRQNKRSDMS
jgi:hypothetical protein